MWYPANKKGVNSQASQKKQRAGKAFPMSLSDFFCMSASFSTFSTHQFSGNSFKVLAEYDYPHGPTLKQYNSRQIYFQSKNLMSHVWVHYGQVTSGANVVFRGPKKWGLWKLDRTP